MDVMSRLDCQIFVSIILLACIHANAEDIGPDTCGQDREKLANWFLRHGPYILPPQPPLTLPLTSDPYSDPANPPAPPGSDPQAVCAIRWTNQTAPSNDSGQSEADLLFYYRLRDFPSSLDALAAGFIVTHQGHCGACSSLQDLGAYMKQNLTDPVRRCSALGWLSSAWEHRCMQELGFSPSCLAIWTYNVGHTETNCLAVCLESWARQEPFNKPDGSLNDCLQCDEDKSGPNFKYFSGRTRRNSGIPSSIKRPSEQMHNMAHCYWYGHL